jgi:hypothetical protein
MAANQEKTSKIPLDDGADEAKRGNVKIDRSAAAGKRKFSWCAERSRWPPRYR